MSTGPVTVAPFRGDVIFTVTVFAAWASAAGGSKAIVHNASTTAAIDVLTLVTSCWQLVLDTRRNTALSDVVVGKFARRARVTSDVAPDGGFRRHGRQRILPPDG